MTAWDCKRDFRTSFFSVRLSEIVIPDQVGNPDSLWLSEIVIPDLVGNPDSLWLSEIVIPAKAGIQILRLHPKLLGPDWPEVLEEVVKRIEGVGL